ncbi:unnamed protein product [Caenorhabditis angaria]|uniref:Uncharacterized protein n=1 Tax=Caenorhabditis angaria TaxID=860376 RepID=A0A9P1IXZ8_9PELO|nr:unnamed protein product [Caenorhabditis angaria]
MCSNPAPEPYRTIVHATEFFTIPVYLATCYTMIFKCPLYFKSYRDHLLCHMIVNILIELIFSSLYIPVPYLPTLMVRSAGFSKDLNLSGLFVIELIIIFVLINGVTVSSMFKFRFESVLSISTKKKTKTYLYFFYFSNLTFAIIIVVFFVTFNQLYILMEKQKLLLYSTITNIPIEVLCKSTILALPLNNLYWLIFVLSMVICMSVWFNFILYIGVSIILIFSGAPKVLSSKTLIMQKSFVRSLFLQTFTHMLFLGFPVACVIGELILKTGWNCGFDFLIIFN